MRALYLIVALSVVSASAEAWEIRSSCARSWYYGHSSCRIVGIPDAPPPPRDPAQEAEDLAEKHKRIANWETFCKPKSVEDRYGVVRLVYAHANCDLGRTR